MSAAPLVSVAVAGHDTLRASASASVAPIAASPAAAAAAAASSLPTAEHELAAVKRRIEDSESEIASVAAQVAVAVSKRDACKVDDPRRLDFAADIQRLSKEKEQLRDEKAFLLKKEERLQNEAKELRGALRRSGI